LLTPEDAEEEATAKQGSILCILWMPGAPWLRSWVALFTMVSKSLLLAAISTLLLFAEVCSDHYSTLGLQHGASNDEVRRAYKKLARQYHPDKVRFACDCARLSFRTSLPASTE